MSNPEIDWSTFWTTTGYTIPKLLPEGASAAIYGEGAKAFVLEIAVDLAAGLDVLGESVPAADVVYADYAGDRLTIRKRLGELGVGASMDLSRLRYCLGGLPDDPAAGLVIIDGDADPETVRRLTAAGTAVLLLSEQVDDVDLAYRLTSEGERATLAREKNRLGLDGDDVLQLVVLSNLLRYVEPVSELVLELLCESVPADADPETCRQALAGVGFTFRESELTAAIARRQADAEAAREAAKGIRW